MIPVAIVFGLVAGRWWRASLVVAAVAWPVMLATGGDLPLSLSTLLVGAGLAVVNAAVGVAIHQLILWSVRRARPLQESRTRERSDGIPR